MAESIDISFAHSSDTDSLVALIELAYRGPQSRAGWTTEADLLAGRRTGFDEVAALFYRPGSWFIRAKVHNELIACAHLQQRDRGLHFGMFAVKPTLQNSGYGKQVLEHVETLARNEFFCDHIEMMVIRQRAALIAWYQRRGFGPTQTRVPFPYGDERFGLPKRPDLEFIVLRKALGTAIT